MATDLLRREDTPLVRAMGQRWLVAAVARALRPGCVADMMPILMGKQGIGKGYALKILFGDEYVTILGGYRLGTRTRTSGPATPVRHR